MVSCYKIYEYWNGKGILENGDISDDSGMGAVENEYFPSCWACRKPVNSKDVFSWEEDTKKLWNDKRINSRLQRCHIIARQFGGGDTPDNLFLLCPDCHAESPDTKNRNAFFRWVYRRRNVSFYGINLKELSREMLKEIESRGWTGWDFVLKCRNVLGKDFGDIISDSLRECGFHGTTVADSTKAICMIDGLEEALLRKGERRTVETNFSDCEENELKKLCELHNLSYHMVKSRMERGLNLKQAITFPKVPHGHTRNPMEYWKQCGCL